MNIPSSDGLLTRKRKTDSFQWLFLIFTKIFSE